MAEGLKNAFRSSVDYIKDAAIRHPQRNVLMLLRVQKVRGGASFPSVSTGSPARAPSGGVHRQSISGLKRYSLLDAHTEMKASSRA